MASQDSPDGGMAFNLNGDSDDFRTKKTDVFGSLDALEKSYQSKLAVRSESDNKRDSRDLRDAEEDDGPNEPFKRPRSPRGLQRSAGARQRDFRSKAWTRREDFGPNRRRNQKPEYEANPSKWKRYSLEDTDVCGNAQNSRIAFDKIRELRERRQQGEVDQKADLDQKVIFSKPTPSPTNQGCRKSYSDVHKMQEYQFGTKLVPKRKAEHLQTEYQSPQNGSSSASLSFDHLRDEDGEHSDGLNQSDDSILGASQSESAIDSSSITVAQEGGTSIDDGQTVSVGFKKKRKGQRNIRNRQNEED